LVELHALDGLLGAVALVCLGAGLEVSHLHLREGAALAWLNQLALEHDPKLAGMLQHVARLDVDGIDLHGSALEIRRARRASRRFRLGRRAGAASYQLGPAEGRGAWQMRGRRHSVIAGTLGSHRVT